MTSAIRIQKQARISFGDLIEQTRLAAPPLFWVGVVMLALSMMALLMAQVDARVFQGVNVWVKPWKFLVSTGVYLLTLALFVSWLPQQSLKSRTAGYIIWVAVVTGVFEVVYVALRAAQGVGSHFNLSSRFDANMYTAMGVGAVLLISASLALAVLVARSPGYQTSPNTKLAIVLGLALTFALGTAFGGYMSAQAGGHWVGGARTDAGGLPIVNWSRTGGDLRVAHFFGVHAMHFIPGFAVLLAVSQVPKPLARGLIWAFAALFSVLCFWTLIEARAGRSFLG